jgi:hypothetical protein
MNTPVEPSPRHGFVSELVARILAFIDRPWKALVVMALLLMLGIGAIAWDKRDAIIGGMFHKKVYAPVLVTVLEEQFSRLQQGTGANLVMFWGLSIASNDIEFIAGQKDGKAWNPTDFNIPTQLPAIGENRDPSNVIAIMQGDHACTDIATANGTGLLIRYMRTQGYQRFCLVPVKPPRTMVIAILVLAWKKALMPREEIEAMSIATDVADSTYR